MSNFIQLSETQAIDIGNILARYAKYVEYKYDELNIKYESSEDVIRELIKVDLDNLSNELKLIQERCNNLGLTLEIKEKNIV